VRDSPIDLTPEEFRALGHGLVERIADFLASLPDRPVNPGESLQSVRGVLGVRPLPESGRNPAELLAEAADLLFEHSLLTGHPRHLAYIIGSPAPIGGLADLLAASLDPNVSSWWRSAMATEIEAQAVRWIAELVGYPADSGGLLTSGGSMANYIGLLAARKARTPWEVRSRGLVEGGCRPLRVYASDQTHAWIEKAADMFGLGTDSIRWIASDAHQRIELEALARAIQVDRQRGDLPLLVVGNAGTTATGAIDPLAELADICKQAQVWLHVDGAYGAFAAMLEDAPLDLHALALADSLALDPHKWLYQPLEAGCALVRDAALLKDTFTYHPPYYRFPPVDGEEPLNFYQLGPQNSRGFRALKVWLSLQQVGRQGYRHMLAEDIRLAQLLYQRISAHPELQAFTNNLSITTFRYVPGDLRERLSSQAPFGKVLPVDGTLRAPSTQQSPDTVESYLNRLNDALLAHLQTSGEVYISNAMLGETFLLRACVVNFRTGEDDIEAIPEIVARFGRQVDRQLRALSYEA
jgi:aromatic-L-amino-acid/L-tryptophan decarboxylase